MVGVRVGVAAGVADWGGFADDPCDILVLVREIDAGRLVSTGGSIARELDLGKVELDSTCAGTAGEICVPELDFVILGILGSFFAGVAFGAGSSGSTA